MKSALLVAISMSTFLNAAHAQPIITQDAEAAAAELSLECEHLIRADQCVIAYFDRNDQRLDSRNGAKYYRVLYGSVNSLRMVQDFYIGDQKQSNIFFSGADAGLYNSFEAEDLALEGDLRIYDVNGGEMASFKYQSGQLISNAQ